MSRHLGRVLARTASVLLATGALISAAVAPASAAEGNIGHVETDSAGVRVLFSLPGLGEGAAPDVETVSAAIDGEAVEARATLAAETDDGIRRTTILALDVSRSMQGEKFEQAKAAAQTFLDTAPLDVFVGIVAFAGEVDVLLEPTLNRAAATDLIDDLQLTLQTRLYEGIQEAVRATGDEGQRSVLVLSDGADTSGIPLSDVTQGIEDADVQVDVVALTKSEAVQQKLRTIAEAGGGMVLEAADPAALSEVFASEAQALARQVLITAPLPQGFEESEGTVAVSIEAGGKVYQDSAFVPLKASPGPVAVALADPEKAVSSAGAAVSPTVMIAGLAALGIAMLLILMGVLGVFSSRTSTVEDRIRAYTLSGGSARTASGWAGASSAPRMSPEGIADSARAVAEKALASNRGLEASLGARLEAAGMAIKPSEWLLTHVGIAFAGGLLGMLFGSILSALVMFGLGLLVPHLYLKIKQSRRVKAFNNQLADTLQLMAGSLSAGLSLAQSADTVVREGTEPMTSEFKRALVEARLGVQMEDSLDSIADRMNSEDFRWVVMAVRIQREVGGNLSEVLTQVAATIRERAYLRRQVKTLSAEGRLSAWILGSLPIVILVFLLFTRPGYHTPMLQTPVGWVLMATGAVLISVGGLWLRKIVQMEV